MLLSTISGLVACSTVFMQANITFDRHAQSDVAVVLANQPWKTLDFIRVPDCGIVVIDETWLRPIMLTVARSRLKASLIVVTENTEELYAYINLNKKLNFDVNLVKESEADEGNFGFNTRLHENTVIYIHVSTYHIAP